MKGIIYVRVSSDEQVKGTSLDFQEENCKKYCNDKGIEILKIFREEGASAKSSARKEFLRAIEYCRKNKIDVFVVHKVDRFARNTEDHFAVKGILLGFGTTLHSVTEPIGESPSEKLLETILAGFADFDNAIRKQRCSDGMSEKINKGLFPWKPPIGYKCGQCKKRGEKKTEPDAPDEKAFPIIQRALKEYKNGMYSKAELGRQLDNWGLKKIRGKKTTPQFVEMIFSEKRLKFYAGIIVNPFENNNERKGLHTPMIKEDELLEIQFVLSGKKNKSVRREIYNLNFPLRRTVVCSYCNRMLTGSTSRGNGGKYHYYHCQNKNCEKYGKAIIKNDLEKLFLNELKKITPKKKFLDFFKRTILKLWEEKGRSFEMDVSKYKSYLNNLEEKKARIFDMREDGSYTQEQFKDRLGEINNKITATKISLSESKIDQFDIEGALEYAIKFIKKLERQWFDLPIKQKIRFQKLVFPKGIPYTQNKGFGTTELGCIYTINRHVNGDLSTMVGYSRLCSKLF